MSLILFPPISTKLLSTMCFAALLSMPLRCLGVSAMRSCALCTLAIWGTAALAVGTCKVLGIKTMDDLKRVMHAQLSPLGDAIRDRMTPFKSYITEAPLDGSPKVNTKDSRFAKGVKDIFA